MLSIFPHFKRLSRTLTHRGGRNGNGRITNFHVGGGSKKRGPVVDFETIPSCSILLDTVKLGRRTGPLSLFYHLFPSSPTNKVLFRLAGIFDSFFFQLGFKSLVFLLKRKPKSGLISKRYSFCRGKKGFNRISSPIFRKSVNWVRNSLINFRISSSELYPRSYFLNLFKRQFFYDYPTPRGFFSYRISTQFVNRGELVFTGHQSSPLIGNRLPLFFIPNGTDVHSVPFNSGRENSFFSLAGKSSSKLLSKYAAFSLLSLPSGEHRISPSNYFATVGSPTSFLYTGYRFYKAGHSRWRGIRPKTRGVATNPVDHPHGGRTQRGKPARSFAFSSIKFRPTGAGRGLRWVFKSRKHLLSRVSYDALVLER